MGVAGGSRGVPQRVLRVTRLPGRQMADLGDLRAIIYRVDGVQRMS